MVCPIGGAADATNAVIMVISARNKVFIVRDPY
jgi:hypothetical protein